MESVPVREAIAIIPAKSLSHRLPEKNLRLFRGLPLFLWSVLYAKEEGIQPVVFTDSAKIRHVAEGFGAIVYPQVEAQFENYGALVPAIKELKPKYIILLQATSPLRKAGMARTIYNNLKAGKYKSCYTAVYTKCVGHLQGKFWAGHAEKNDANKFYQADGNIWACTSEYFFNHNNYFAGNDSYPVSNVLPYALQIDTWDDFRTLDLLARAKHDLLVHPIKKIVSVQNQRCINRDYSEFIDGCDLVVRAGKLDNVDTGRTGKRTDIVFSHTYAVWWNFSPQEQHLNAINKAPLVYMDPRWVVPDTIKYSFYWPCAHIIPYTTSCFAVYCLREIFPEAKIYNFGTHDVRQRTDTLGLGMHRRTNEKEYYDKLVQDGVLIDISEEDKTDSLYVYSTEPKWDTHSPEKIKLLRPVWGSDRAWAYIYPWLHRIVISTPTTPPAGNLVRWIPGEYLAVAWDRSDRIVCYKPQEDGCYAQYDVIKVRDIEKAPLGEELPILQLEYTHLLTCGQFSAGIGNYIGRGPHIKLFEDAQERKISDVAEALCGVTQNLITEDVRKVLNNAEAKVVVLYAGVKQADGYWFNMKEAYDSLCRLQQTFSADISLVYLAVPEAPEERKSAIIYSDPHLLAGTYEAPIVDCVIEQFNVCFRDIIYDDADRT